MSRVQIPSAMDPIILYICLSIVLLFLANKLFFQHSHINLPPSPNGLPFIGHLHLLKPPIHSTLLNLSQKHGPIISLRFGFRRVVVVSCSSLAQECFTKNDVVLANRPRLTSGKHIGYNYTTIFESPYGDHWRNLRRICALEIFSTNRLNMFTPIRQDEIKRLIFSLHKISTRDFVKVNLKSKLSELTFNVVVRMVAGKRYYGEDVQDSEEGNKFRDLNREISRVCAATNPGDFLPFLKWIDFTGHEKDCARIIKKMDAFLQGLIDEQRIRSENNNNNNNNTMIDNLLSLQKSQPEYYSDQIIKGLILAMLNAGTDTISGTLEWAMSVLLNHPEVLEKAKIELDTHIGNGRLVEEQDLPKLSYIHQIIQETQRLFPAGPLLGPHESSDNCEIGGYNVPRGTIVLVNAWAIHRDPKVYDDPTCFKPERFENDDIEEPKLLPFGMGRRACPGSSLAYRVMELTLASLIQCFDWKRVNEEENIDLTEGMGLTMHKVVPLEAMCKIRD